MRFIHVGVGGFGQVWGNALKENKNAEVVALVDVNPAAIDAACENGGYDRAIGFPSLEKALASVEADAVVSTTPPAFHKRDVVTALKAGLHVISEKPMSDTLPACKAMVKMANETGRLYVVSQNYRYQPAMWTLAQLVRSGKLGPVGQVKLDFFKGVDFGGGFRHDMPYPVIIDMSIHHFDLIRFITGLDAETVTGAAWNPPWSNYKGDCSSTALFEMNNGARALYNASWCAKGDFCDWNGNWQIECAKGAITYASGEISLRLVPKLYHTESVETVEHSAPPLCGQAFVLDEFIRAAGSGNRPGTAAQDNIRSVAMVFAAVKAMRTGRKVAVLDETIRRLSAQHTGGPAFER